MSQLEGENHTFLLQLPGLTRSELAVGEIVQIDGTVLLALLEKTQEFLELLTAEIPLDNPRRRIFEQGLPQYRALISAIREQVRGDGPEIPPVPKNI